jgi:hypothetical protein
VAAPWLVTVLQKTRMVRPVLRDLACNPALGPDRVGVAAGAVDVKEAPATGDGRLSCAATEAASAVSGPVRSACAAGGCRSGDISVALTSGIHGPLVGEQSIDVERDAGVDLLGAVGCVDCAAFEEARDVDGDAAVHAPESASRPTLVVIG